MASTLLDAIRKNRGAAAPSTAPVGTTAAVSRSLATAASGRAAPATGPRISNLAEQQAATQGAQQLTQQREQTTLASGAVEQQVADQEQAESLAVRRVDEQRAGVEQRSEQAQLEILDRLEQNRTRLSQAEQIADIEQLGFQYRLGNEKYVYQLQDAGRRQRLTDETQFREALQEEVYGELTGILENELNWKRGMDVSDRDFAREIAKMDVRTAMEILNAEIRAQNQRQIAEGLGDLVSGGIQAAALYKPGKTPGAADASGTSGAAPEVVNSPKTDVVSPAY